MRPPLVIAAFVLTWVSAAAPAVACTCLTTSGSVVNATALFEATVDRIEGPSGPGGMSTVHLRDVVAVRGASPSVLINTGDTCAFGFRVGTRYLIDAREYMPGQYTTSSCSSTRRIDEAGALLAYLRAEPPTRPRVFGQLSPQVATPGRGPEVMTPPIAGAAVCIRGPVERTVVSSGDGAFAFADAPPGRYELTVAPPADRRDLLASRPRPFEVESSAECVEMPVSLPSSASVSGQVLDPAGQPAAGVRVELYPAPYNQWAGGLMLAATTDAQGRYRIERVPPGRYAGGLGVPYPSARNAVIPALMRSPAGDTAVVVDPGQAVDVPDLVAQPAPLIKVSGVVIAADGVQKSNLRLVLQSLDGFATARTMGGRTMGGGRFVLDAHRGVRYRVVVDHTEYTGETEFVAGEGDLAIQVLPARKR